MLTRVNCRIAEIVCCELLCWFALNAQILPPPALSAPANGSIEQPATLTMSWTGVLGATGYRLQVSADSGFASPVVDDSALTDTFRQVGPLASDTVYYWRVMAANLLLNSDWSERWSFRTIPAAPAPFARVSPVDGATNQGVSGTLSWEASTGATGYDVYIDRDNPPATLVSSNQSGTSYTYTGLVNGTHYYWEVAARNSGGTTTATGAPWGFTTIAAPPPAPALTSPANGATGVSTSPILTWDNSPGASSYRMQISADSSFSSLTGDDSSIATPLWQLSGLENNTKYYWRVSAQNGGGISAWSDAWSFTTAAALRAQRIPLGEGWNMISGFVRPRSTNLDSICLAIQQNMVILKNGSGLTFWPAFGINTIGTWNTGDGYQLYMMSADTLTLEGFMPDSSTIPLAQGWNMVSYLRTRPMDVESCLASIAASVVIAKNNLGQVYWPEYAINTIGTMDAGQGYQMYMSRASVLSYPAERTISPTSTIAAIPARTDRRLIMEISRHESNSETLTYFSFTSNTGNNATVAIPSSANPVLSGIPLASGDEIAAFTPAGLCAGAVVWAGENTAITVWGDNDQTSGVDGMRGGEQISYRIWQKSTNTVFTNVHVTYAQGDGLYQANGIYAIASLNANPTGVRESGKLPAQFSLNQNFPNPFNPSTVIKYGLPSEAMITLDVFDMTGRRIALLVNEKQRAGYHEIVFQNPNLESGTYLYRLRTAAFTSTKKMMILR